MSEHNWEWWAGSNEEHYSLGPFTSRDEAIAEAEDYYDGDEGFFIIEAVRASRAQLIPPAYRVIEDALECAADEGAFGEDCDFDLLGSKEEQREAFKALDGALADWLEKFGNILPHPYRFDASRNGEYISTQQEQPK